mgnify:CR=1 FL=1
MCPALPGSQIRAKSFRAAGESTAENLKWFAVPSLGLDDARPRHQDGDLGGGGPEEQTRQCYPGGFWKFE